MMATAASAWRRPSDLRDPHWENVISLLNFSGSLNDAVGPPWEAVGDVDQFDGHIHINGGTSGIRSSAVAPLEDSDFTMEGVFLPQSLEPSTVALGFSAGLRFMSCEARISAHRFRFLYSRTTGGAEFTSVDEDIPLITGRTHWAVCRAGGSLYAFIGGELVAVGEVSGSFATPVGYAYVGRRQPGTYGEFLGEVHAIRITKGVARYTSSFTPPAAPFPDR